MEEAQARNGGDYDKAAKEVMGNIAQWEADREAREVKGVEDVVPVTLSDIAEVGGR